MRKPKIASSKEKAQELALECINSQDWRIQFLAFYYLQFYMQPREIMKFLNVRPSWVNNHIAALKKLRKEPKLIRLESLKAVLETDQFKLNELLEKMKENELHLSNRPTF